MYVSGFASENPTTLHSTEHGEPKHFHPEEPNQRTNPTGKNATINSNTYSLLVANKEGNK